MQTAESLSVADFARRLNVSVHSICRLVKRPECPPFVRLGTKIIRWDRQVVEDWIRERSGLSQRVKAA